jgi:hypothetical protein
MLLSALQTAEGATGSQIAKATKSAGLCLIIGDDSLTLAADLAKNGNFYVQVLQKDPKKALALGAAIAESPLREKMGIRISAFDANDYGSELFNLIIVKNPAALGNVKFGDLNRMLVPNGSILFTKTSSSLAAMAKERGMKPVAAGNLKGFQRGPLKENWRPADGLKWRAGARAHWSSGWNGLTFGAGKFAYTERLEVPNDKVGAREMLFVRDAYNGRVLWKRDLGYDTDRRGGSSPCAVSDDNVVMAVGRVKGGGLNLLGLDGNTGKVLFSIATEGNPPVPKIQQINFHKGRFFAYGEGWVKVYDTKGKQVWTKRWGYRSLFQGDKAFSYNGQQLQAVKATTGAGIWKLAIRAGWSYPTFITGDYIHIKERNGGKVYSVSIADGKRVSTYTMQKKPLYRNYLTVVGNDLYDCWHYPYPKGNVSDLFWVKVDPKTGKAAGTVHESGTAYKANMCAPPIHGKGKYLVYFFNVWVEPETSRRSYTYLSHPSCFMGTKFAYNLSYNVPSRKAGPLQGIAAIGAADMKFDNQPGGKILEKFSGRVTARAPARNTDWPLYRGNLRRGNASKSVLTPNLKQIWESKVSLGGYTFGETHEQRLGLTQPVSAWGLVIVADITAQRIVALDAKTGKEKWVFHVGSRVDASPALYKGMCLFASKDGWVWCLDAKTGNPVYRLLMAPKKRLIGGQDKLESQWPVVSDVMISKEGVGYVSCGIDTRSLGGIRAMAFKPETGQVIWTKCYDTPGPTHVFKFVAPDLFIQDGRRDIVFMGNVQLNAQNGAFGRGRKNSPTLSLTHQGSMDDWLAGGVSVPRNLEDRAPIKLSSGVGAGKTLAFNGAQTVGYTSGSGTEWAYNGKLSFFSKGSKTWDAPDNKMAMDAIVLTDKFVYTAGYFYGVPGEPELRVVNAANGKVVKKYPLKGHSEWDGMSIAGKKLFIATREGKVICFQSQ